MMDEPKDVRPARSWREEELEKTGLVTCEEARAIARRYNASHFCNHRDVGEHARYTIPVDFSRDDDVRLSAFITQAEAAYLQIVDLASSALAQKEEAKREAQAHRMTEQNAILRYLAPFIGDELAEEIRNGKHLEVAWQAAEKKKSVLDWRPNILAAFSPDGCGCYGLFLVAPALGWRAEYEERGKPALELAFGMSLEDAKEACVRHAQATAESGSSAH